MLKRHILDTLEEIYLEPMKDRPELYIGVELEFPIVNKKGLATDISVSKALMVYLTEALDFQVERYDDFKNPIQLKSRQNDDLIVFELSYNTLEFAFEKSKSIKEIEERFKVYLAVIQAYLAQYHHEIRGCGIHPNWHLNDNSPVAVPRYQMLAKYLEFSKQEKSNFFHDYTDYGTFICGNQVQMDVSRENYLRVINVFNAIEPVKAYLFANSEFPKEDWDSSIARDIFWEQSMHGFFEENVGINRRDFKSTENFLEYLSKTSIFNVERDGQIYYFKSIRVCDYFNKEKVLAQDLKGRERLILPEINDLQWHRCYHYQNLTKRGTIEFRSVCTQTLEESFTPIAFHYGLMLNLDRLEFLISTSDFYKDYGRDYRVLRRQFSKKVLTSKEKHDIQDLSASLISCAYEGLKKIGEEVYLSPLIEKFTLDITTQK